MAHTPNPLPERFARIAGALPEAGAVPEEDRVPFQTVPDTYYEKLDGRVKNHGEDKERLKKLRILVGAQWWCQWWEKIEE